MKKKLFIYISASLLSSQLYAQSGWIFEREITVDCCPEGGRLTKFDVSFSGDFYAIDQNENRLLKLSKNGRVEKWIGGFGWRKEQFDTPSDIWVTGLDIFVSDKNNHRIQRFDMELNYISTLEGDNESADMEFEYPSSVAQSQRGNVYVADPVNGKVIKFSGDGEFLLEFGGIGYGRGRLIEPVSIAVSLNEKVLIADIGKNQILEYDEFGNFLGIVGEGLQYEPSIVVAAETGGILVLDEENMTLYSIEKDGRGYSKIELPEYETGFVSPIDLAVRGNKLYILDSNEKRIITFVHR